MREIRVKLDDIQSTVIDIGYVGENDHTRVVIICSAMFSNYPDAVATMVANPPVGDLYPVTLTKSKKCLIWDVSSSDLAYSGSGSFQLTFTEGTEIIKTSFGAYSVKASMSVTGDPPTPLEDWLEKAEEALESFDQDVSDAEAWAAGTRDGVPVGSSDPAYHNNAKYWADHLNISVSGTTLVLNE